ncbi:MAG: extracellular solute-binding protein [Trueperaceae bacterium]|nr:MAG: extracellular solute-binding protein [Trueperaceae bacterium]
MKQAQRLLAVAIGPLVLMLVTSVLAQEVRIFTFEGYTDDAWVQEFEADTGCGVNVTYTGSVDEMFARMVGSDGADFDLISIDTSLFGRYTEQGLLRPYDVSALPNVANLLPAFQRVEEAIVDDEVYGIPIAWGSLGLIYDVDEVSPAPTSWDVLWSEEYENQIIVLDDTNNNIVNAAIILGFDDPFNLNEAQMEEVKALLIDQKRVLQSYYAGFEEGNNIWESGGAVLMFSMGEFQAVDLRDRGYNVEYIIPDEGGIGWLDTWAMSKGVQDVECAQAWVDFFLRPELGTDMSVKYGYGNTTAEVEGLDYAGRLTWLAPAEDFNWRTQVWNEIKATPVQ